MESSIFLRRIGFTETYIGFPYLACAVTLVQSDRSYLYQLFKTLYPAVADRFQTSPACVERDIRTLIRAFWQSGRGQALVSALGHPLLRRPTNGEMIALLAGYLSSGQ